MRSFRLAPMDDDNDTSPLLTTSTSDVGMPPRLAINVTLATSSVMSPAILSATPPTATRLASTPRGRRQKSVAVRARKAPHVGVEDALGRATTTIDMAGDERPSFSPIVTQEEISSQGLFTTRANNSA